MSVPLLTIAAYSRTKGGGVRGFVLYDPISVCYTFHIQLVGVCCIEACVCVCSVGRSSHPVLSGTIALQVGLIRLFTMCIDRHKKEVIGSAALQQQAQNQMAAVGAANMVAILMQETDPEVLFLPASAHPTCIQQRAQCGTFTFLHPHSPTPTHVHPIPVMPTHIHPYLPALTHIHPGPLPSTNNLPPTFFYVIVCPHPLRILNPHLSTHIHRFTSHRTNQTHPHPLMLTTTMISIHIHSHWPILPRIHQISPQGAANPTSPAGPGIYLAAGLGNLLWVASPARKLCPCVGGMFVAPWVNGRTDAVQKYKVICTTTLSCSVTVRTPTYKLCTVSTDYTRVNRPMQSFFRMGRPMLDIFSSRPQRMHSITTCAPRIPPMHSVYRLYLGTLSTNSAQCLQAVQNVCALTARLLHTYHALLHWSA